MSPRTGRPTTDPKTFNKRIRLSDADVKMLKFSADKLGINTSEVIRLGIKKVYDEVNK